MLGKHSAVFCTNELGAFSVGSGLLSRQLQNKYREGNEYGLPAPCRFTTDDFLDVVEWHSPKPWYIDKHPLYLSALPHAAQYVEKIICVLRHPLEVIESMLKNWTPGADPIALPWVFERAEDCIKPPNRLPSWYDLMSRWEAWKGSPACPFLEVHYSELGNSAKRIAAFLDIDEDELERIFSTSFNHRAFPLPSVQLPAEWIDLVDRLGIKSSDSSR